MVPGVHAPWPGKPQKYVNGPATARTGRGVQPAAPAPRNRRV